MATVDFNRMQAHAIRTAREMQQRATPPIYSEPPPEPKREPPPQQKYPPPKEVFSHNQWTQAQQTPFCRNACPIKNILSPPGKGADNDVMLLMALMLLLSADGGDKMLMLALMYIMT